MLNKYQSIYMIGIGGISMSGIAHILLHQGYRVAGSDRTDAPILEGLRRAGAKIFIGHRGEQVAGCDLVVYTAAISADNVELAAAREQGIPAMERADFLGLLMQQYRMPLAVCGTHGKTTTTSMLACALLRADADPTVLVGGELAQIAGNFRVGAKDYLAFEACEYVDSFLKFYPKAAIVLNIEEDHLDYFSGLEQIQSSFITFMKKLEPDGLLVYNADDETVVQAAEAVSCKKISYGKKGDYAPADITYDEEGKPSFTVLRYGEPIQKLSLQVTGEHNVGNALAVYALCDTLDLPMERVKEGIEECGGAARRFEKKGSFQGVQVIDDYAHHPTEIGVTLTAARRMTEGILWCVFQPHTYTRTKALLPDFAEVLAKADRVIVTDIYAAREKDPGDIHARDLAARIPNAAYISSFSEIADYLKNNAKAGDVVFTMGAGSVTNIGSMLVEG